MLSDRHVVGEHGEYANGVGTDGGIPVIEQPREMGQGLAGMDPCQRDCRGGSECRIALHVDEVAQHGSGSWNGREVQLDGTGNALPLGGIGAEVLMLTSQFGESHEVAGFDPRADADRPVLRIGFRGHLGEPLTYKS